MKAKRKVLIGLMAMSLLGGIGGALALTRNAAAVGGTAGGFDQAIYLNWTTDSATASLGNIENLKAKTNAYKYLTVAPKSTKTVAGTVTLTFTLAVSTGDHHIKGLTVSVFETTSLADDTSVATAIDGKTPTPVLNESNLTGTTTFSISGTTGAAQETTKYYAIQVYWTGANDSSNTSYTMDAKLTIAQSFSANS